MENKGKHSGPQLAHLEQLFLVAQFISKDADQAARLVDTIYKGSKTNTSATDESLSELVSRLSTIGDSLDNRLEATRGLRDHSEQARRYESEQYLASSVRLQFLLLAPRDRIDLWRCVETDLPLLPEHNALDAFKERLVSHLDVDQRAVFGNIITREAVARALRSYWSSAFVPVPPTLRSVVESRGGHTRPTDLRADRSATAELKRPKKNRMNRVLLYTWVILAAGFIGYLLTRLGTPTPPSTDIIELSLSAASDVDITFRTGNAEQAEMFIADRLGWRLSTPEITQASLLGIGLTEILDSIELPVLIFSDNNDDTEIPVFAFSYGFLENHRDQFGLARGTLRQIQESAGFDVHELDGRTAVIWRDRDDIFVAFVEGSGTEFQARIIIRS
ncbi:MAG: hypothetical protein BMS9Abin05_0107 [Rhodothermia bacterium]|nr:MAG: hypothetical protein BMS9Abin05_0107 [Rhodothermia bacterium]